VIGVFGRRGFSRRFRKQGSIVSRSIKVLGVLGISPSLSLKLNILSSTLDSRLL
jgi:hypothetical protein